MNDITSDDNTTENQSPECSDANDGKQDCIAIPKRAAFAESLHGCFDEAVSNREKGEDNAFSLNKLLALEGLIEYRIKEEKEEEEKELRRKKRRGEFNDEEGHATKAAADARQSDSAEDCEDNDAENDSSENQPDSTEPSKPLAHDSEHGDVKASDRGYGFQYIPAGFTPLKLAGCHVYIRKLAEGKVLEKFQIKKLYRKAEKWGATIIGSPERGFVWIEASEEPKGPSDIENWEYFNTDPFSEDCFMADEITDWIMASFYYFNAELNGGKKEFAFSNPNLKLLMDSGGFQLSTRQTKYIGPIEVAKIMAKYVNRGVTLDIPPTSMDYYRSKIVRLLALAQKSNTEIMKKELPSGFELLNVIHGADYYSQLEWLEIVRDPYCKGYAIGFPGKKFGLQHMPIIAKLMYDEKAETLHILGSGSFKNLALYCVMGKYGKITSDSSTVIGESLERKNFLQWRDDGTVRVIDVGRNSTAFPDTLGNETGCQCPVCQKIPFPEIYNYEERFKNTYLLALHNAWVYKTFVEYWSKMVREAGIEAAAKHFGKCFGGKSLAKREELEEEMIIVDRYLAMAEKEGTDAAYEEFSEYWTEYEISEDEEVDYGAFSSDDYFYRVNKKSSIYLLPKYLPQEVLTKHGFPPEFFGKEPVNGPSAKDKKIMEKRGFLLSIFMEKYPVLKDRFNSDLLAFWKAVRKVIKDGTRRCLADQKHELEFQNKDGYDTLFCRKCGYELSFEEEKEDEEKDKRRG